MSDNGIISARARVGELIPQPHGGAIHAPFQRGVPQTGWKATRKAVLATLRDMTPAGAAKLKELTQSPDDRVAVVAVKELLDRTLGKPTDLPQGEDEGLGSLDLTKLSAADRSELSGALATIRRLTGRGPGALGGPVIDV